MRDVREWYANNAEKTRYYGGRDSFIAPNANYEYQIDACLSQI